jgi:ATP-dependent RNA helicase DDX3X
MSWGMGPMGDVNTGVETPIEAPVSATATPVVTPAGNFSGVTPQELGWVTKTEYDYQTYLKSSKELADSQITAVTAGNISDAVGGIRQGDWASNAAIYTWDDDYGDVGPKFPELERQLFGSEYHVKTGIAFDK